MKSPSDFSCKSYELFVGQEKGMEDKDTKERSSVKSADGESIYEQKSRINGKGRKVCLNLSFIFFIDSLLVNIS